MPDSGGSGGPGGGSRGGSGGGADYGWLYGGKSGSGQPAGGSGRGGSQDPEPTQVMPKIDRPGSSRAGGGGSGGGGGRPPSQPVKPARTPKAPRRRWPAKKIILTLLVAWLVFLIAVPLWAWSNIEKVDIEPKGERPSEQPGSNYLLVGSDSRKGLTKEEAKRLGTGSADVGNRTDTIMLLHTGDGPNLLLSLPRDSIVNIPGQGTNKINSAFAIGGPKLLVKTIEQNTGLRVDHYVETGFGGFANMVDAVGGVEICPKQRMVDKLANLRIKKGCQEADGATALGYARSRHLSQYGDLDRARRQREVVSAIGSEVKSPWTFINPIRYFRVNKAASSSVKISEGTGPFALANFGLAMTRVNGENGLTCGMPIADQAIHWDRQRALALLRYIKDDNTGEIPKRLCTATGLPGVRD